ncbi:DUF3841 domain-containing protein [Ktedonospora formicarum]|uniref:DUF3841 domain-containing protein n=1 Tax=Ktedonospora formicarum TaxID=2778364 RepID=A0A8J3HY87_9CHLR|nr:DUF3841 domain-containing protein [Ktedonospora formicarum]GHO43320.1 hypothetical protein KSX_14830 [Ktedonospora formicarum]
MIAWTIQLEANWLKLQRDGVLYGPQATTEYSLHNQEFLAAYDWMTAQLEQRIGPRPLTGQFPLWAWYQYESAQQRRPDLRHVGHIGHGERGVRIEFHIDEQDILLSGFDEWHCVLNNHYLALNEIDDQSFYTAFDPIRIKRGQDEAMHQFREQIVSSWERIFDLDLNRFTQEDWWAAREDKSIQGTFWALHLEQVRTTTLFIGR